MIQSKERLFIIDGMAQIYRAHFAMINNPLTTKDGRHTSVIYGFLNMLFKIIRDESPDYLVIAMDSKAKTFRHEMNIKLIDPKCLMKLLTKFQF